MEIRILQGLGGAARAEGLAVVIDVLRAASHVVVMFERGAAAVHPVASLEEARALRQQHPDWLLAGERHGLPPPDFDLGNSPQQTAQHDLHGRTLVLSTSAGSKGLVAAAAVADAVFFGCFRNARALAAVIRRRSPAVLSLVAMGVDGLAPSPEDDLAAAVISEHLIGRRPDFARITALVSQHPQGRKFLEGRDPAYTVPDFHACLSLDVSQVVPELRSRQLVPVQT